MKRICTIAVGLALFGAAGTAQAANVDFEGFGNGATVDFAGFGTGIFAVSATNGNGIGPDNATVMNSEGSSNSNIKHPYSSGNLKTSRLRKVLIIPSANSNTAPSPQGGQLTLTFFQPLKTFGFDVGDVDSSDAATTTVTFRYQGSDIVTIPFSEFRNMNSPYKRPGVVWGNNSANRIAPLTAAMLGAPAEGFDEVVFDFPSEMAFDNINYRVNPIPEPAAAGLIFGLPALAALRRRRRA
jgi:hypothetical protein